jgi:2-haloacid dehalogenase
VDGIRWLLFDVLGTVVDEGGSLREDAAAALASAGGSVGAGAAALVAAWLQRHDELIGQIRSGSAPWRPNDALRRAALADAAAATGYAELPAAVMAELSLAGHRLRPWPDSAAALQVMRASRTVIALSNATAAELVSMSAAGGLAWHGVVSAELARAYKPDPRVYRLALDLLGLDPGRTMMVAAHPWDLRAAAAQGLRTAYVERPGEGAADDDFDIRAGSLAELASLSAR